MISRVLTCLWGKRLSWKSQFSQFPPFLSHVQQANRDPNKNQIPLTPLRPAGNTKVPVHLSRNFSILGGGDSFDRIPARRGQRVMPSWRFYSARFNETLVFWLIRMFIHQGGWQSFYVMAHYHFIQWSICQDLPSHLESHQSPAAIRFYWLMPSGQKTNSTKILAYYKYKPCDVYAYMALKKSMSLPFCKPFLFPNGFKTKK